MGRALSILAKTRAQIASHGLGGLVHLLRERLSAQRYHLYRCDLPRTGRKAAAAVAVERGDLRELRAWRQRRATMPMSFERDHTDAWTCFHWVRSDGEPAGIVWTVTESPFATIRGDERVVAALYTVPSQRNRGIGRALIAAACDDLIATGIRRVYATIHESNTASRKTFESVGFQSIGVRHVRGFAWARIDPDDWSASPDAALGQHRSA